ncbi:peptidoglycan DD-metalloendopeptidase family protein [Flavobacterium sp. UMI-01]|uniref:peptidoglycan DD-metalloendopeptidase family protein n=1 Tax=Flavobacterium sp. UMI-01 TaxID=1441053 RepID=UPI001C7D116C|nr:peptidoglycan DD-metalloendopeptidase family protein [Flavobacterium sp. UMI-01]GIZ08521.1 hypothetical protein FUMI01_12480 [Flavobacterium sp. UMI-01]
MKLKLPFIIGITLVCLGTSIKTLAQQNVIEVTSVRNNDNTVDIKYIKKMPGSYVVKLKFTNFNNTYVSDFEKVLKYDQGDLIRLNPENKEAPINFAYSVSYSLGNNEPKVDSLFQYILPFKKRKKITVQESNNVNEKYYGAEKIESWKSYSVSSKTPDSVYAMRKGIVVQIKNEYQMDTLSRVIFTSKTNSVLIEHEDGTYAIYKGFKKDSFKVKLGDVVYPETMLGVLSKFDNSRHVLHFNIYYYDQNRKVDNTNATFKTAKSPYAYLTPYFYTKEGVIKIVPKDSYTAESNATLITKEMSKREMKQHLKSKSI